MSLIIYFLFNIFSLNSVVFGAESPTSFVGSLESTTEIKVDSDSSFLESYNSIANYCCANPEGVVFSEGYSCAKLGSGYAASCIHRKAYSAYLAASTQWESFIMQIPKADLKRLIAKCPIDGLHGYGFKVAQCMNKNLGLIQDPSVDRASLEKTLDAWQGAEALAGVLTYACIELVTKQNGGSHLGQTPEEFGCSTIPLKPTKIPYNPEQGRALALGPASGSSSDILDEPAYSVTDIISGFNPISCPDFIPRDECHSGSALDFARYQRKTEIIDLGVEGAAVREFYEYEPTTNPALGSQDLGTLFNDSYPFVRKAAVEEITDSLAELSMEKYLQALALSSYSPQRRKKEIQALSEGAACLPGGQAMVKDLVTALPKPEELEEAKDRYFNSMVHGAQCMQRLEDRLKELSYELGRDVVIARPAITSAELDQLPIGIRQLTDGVTNLPIARHFLREFDWPVGIEEEGKRPCSLVQLSVNPVIEGMSRESYCTNTFAEFTLLTYEMNDLYMTYPELAAHQDKSNEPAYRALSGGSTGIDPKVSSYNLDSNRSDFGHLIDPSTGILKSCMGQWRSNPVSPTSELIPADPKAIEAAKKSYDQAVDEELATFRSQIADLCNDPEKYATEAVKIAPFMQKYFDCDRSHFPLLYDSMRLPADQWPNGVSPETCQRHEDSSLLVCQMYRDAREKEDLAEAAGQIFQVAMDGLFFVAPGISGIGTARQVAVSTGIGATVGGGIGYFFAPTASDAAGTSRFSQAQYYEGLGTVSPEEFAVAQKTAAEVQTLYGNPKFNAVLNGAVIGGAFGVLGSGAGPGKGSAKFDRSKLRLSDADLPEFLTRYRKLEVEGALDGPAGLKARQASEAILDENLRARFAQLDDEALKQLSTDQKMALLEGRMTLPKGGSAKPSSFDGGVPAASTNADDVARRLRQPLQFNGEPIDHWHTVEQTRIAPLAEQVVRERVASGRNIPKAIAQVEDKIPSSGTNEFSESWLRGASKQPEYQYGSIDSPVPQMRQGGGVMMQVKNVQIGNETRYFRPFDGNKADKLRRSYAASWINESMGIDVVPKTEIAQVNGQRGLLSREAKGAPPVFMDKQQISQSAYSEAKAFEFLIGQGDGHSKDARAVVGGVVQYVDHEQAFSRGLLDYNQKFVYEFGRDLPERYTSRFIESLRRMDPNDPSFVQNLGRHLTPGEMEGFFFRREMILRDVETRGSAAFLPNVTAVQPTKRELLAHWGYRLPAITA